MNTEDFQGYLVKSTLNTVAETLFQKEFPYYEHDSWNNNVQLDGYNFQKNTSAAHYFKRLGVLDLWFDKVTEKKIELPSINSYTGKIEGDFIKYGCAEIPVSWFLKEGNRSLSEITLNSGVKINSEQIKQIQKYVAKFG